MSLSSNNETSRTNEFGIYGSDSALEPRPEYQKQPKSDSKKEQIYNLQKKIYEMDKEIQQNKTKRNLMMVGIFSLIIFILFVKSNNYNSIEQYAGMAIVSIILGGIYFLLNATIFHHYVHVNDNENRRLENLKKELSELYREYNSSIK